MSRELPYGAWLEKGGSLVLFNRAYQPIWRRTPAGVTTLVDDPPRWPNCDKIWIEVEGGQQEYFYDGGCLPWNCDATRALCEWILRRVFDVPA
jgi:hypothetical protein